MQVSLPKCVFSKSPSSLSSVSSAASTMPPNRSSSLVGVGLPVVEELVTVVVDVVEGPGGAANKQFILILGRSQLKASRNEENNLTEKNCFQPNQQCENVFHY